MQENVHKFLLKLSKRGELKYISHLDWQNLILKSLRRSGVEFVLSEGFSPTPKISFSPALPLFIESECELVNFASKKPLPTDFIDIFHKNTSENLRIISMDKYPFDNKKLPSLDILTQYASYEATLLEEKKMLHKIEDLKYNIEKCLSKDDMFIKKINKKGIEKNINYKNSIFSLELKNNCVMFTLKTGQNETIPALRADDFLKAVFGEQILFNIKRTNFFDKNMQTI